MKMNSSNTNNSCACILCNIKDQISVLVQTLNPLAPHTIKP